MQITEAELETKLAEARMEGRRWECNYWYTRSHPMGAYKFIERLDELTRRNRVWMKSHEASNP